MVVNWAGNVRFHAERVHAPDSVEQLCELVATASRVHCLGTGHSFSDVADTAGVLVSVRGLPARIDVDRATATVRVSAGLRWGDLAPVLHREGFALHNLGSLPHITVSGSCQTGTHGSGDRAACLAAAVRELEIVDATGNLVKVGRGDPDFAGQVVALGALGVVTALTLDLEPTYDVRQTVFERLPWSAATTGFDAVTATGAGVSLFTTWQDDAVEQVWVKQRAQEEPADLSWAGAVPADGPRHPIAGMSPRWCTDQLGTTGPWYTRLPHFRLEFTPSSGEELQTEYLLPRRHAAAAIEVVRELRERVGPVLQISEIRTIAADDLWLSPAYERDSVAIHFTWIADPPAVLPVVGDVERALLPFGPRPHWGKVFTTPTELLAQQYPRWAQFRDLAVRLDPGGRFRNPFLERTVLRR